MTAAFPFVQGTVLESLPVIVNVIGPVALITGGDGVLCGERVAVNVAP
jgi:hypothetical protein